MKRKRTLKAAIIGCGRIAGLNELDPYREKPCTHLGAYRTRRDIEIIGCCDADINAAKHFAELFKIPFYTDSVKELMKNKIDVISICVPYKLHKTVLTKVLNAKQKPKIIFLEKPISDSYKNAKEMVQLCKKNKVKLYVNNRRLSTFYSKLREVIKNEFNNEIISISAWCSSGIHTIGIHMVDLMRSLCGEAKWLLAVKEKKKVKKLPFSTNFTNDDPRFNALIQFNNGTKANMINTATTDFTYFEIEALCKKGRVRASDNGGKLIVQKKIKPGKSTLSYKLGKERLISYKARPLFKELIDEVIDGTYKNSAINAEEALKSYEIIEKMKESAKTNRIAKLKK